MCGIDALIFASSPLGGGLRHAALQRPNWPVAAWWLSHCSFPVGILEIPRASAVVFLERRIMLNFEPQAIEHSMSTQPQEICPPGTQCWLYSHDTLVPLMSIASALQVHNLSSSPTDE